METGASCVEKWVLQFAWWRKGDAVNQNIDAATEDLTGPCKCGVELIVLLNIAENQLGSRNLRRQIADVFLHALLIGENELSAFSGERLRNGPGNRPMVSNAKDKGFFAL